MTKVKKLAEHIADELSDAKEYAEKYIECKAAEKSTPAARYKEMAEDELKHARYIHDMATQEIEALEKVFTPPENMREAWEKSHREYVERAAWIKQMLAM